MKVYLGKELCLVSLGTKKLGWYSPKSPLCVVSIIWKMKKKRANKDDEDGEW